MAGKNNCGMAGKGWREGIGGKIRWEGIGGKIRRERIGGKIRREGIGGEGLARNGWRKHMAGRGGRETGGDKIQFSMSHATSA